MALVFVAVISLAGLPALALGNSIIAQVSGLYQLAAAPNPYFQFSHAALLYLVTPAIVISSFVLFLLPGALLALTLGQARSFETLVVFSFGSSLLLSIALSTLAKLMVGTPLTAPMLLGMWLGTAGAASFLLIYRVRKGVALAWPFKEGSDFRRLFWMLGALAVSVALLTPKVFWENFNLDGIEAFEFGRSLTTSLLPGWEVSEGVFGFYHNFWLFAYPNHWFITLLGPVEAAARLPFFLYLIVIFALLVLLIELGSPRKLSGIEESALWLGLALYTVVQAFSTNYEPFYADLAETAATDSLGILVFLGACYSLWSRRSLWFALFALMTHFATPGGLLLLGLLAVFTFLAKSPQRWAQLRLPGVVLLVCLAIGIAYERLYAPLALRETASQFSGINLLRRLFPPTFTEFARFNALLFTTGLLPAVSLLLVRRTDWPSWILAGVTLGYFGVLYLQAWTSLHQFTPVMIIPLIVFWRLYLNWRPQAQKWALPALTTTALVSIVLSMPQHFQVNLAVREFGQATEYRVGDYQQSYEAAAAGSWALSALLPSGYRLEYPHQPWGADQYSWVYYATREKPAGTAVNYVIQPAREPAPSRFTKVLKQDGVAVYVRDLQMWQRHQGRDLPQVVASPLYEPILRSTYQFFREYHDKAQQAQDLSVQP
jgi:hypothetical protein